MIVFYGTRMYGKVDHVPGLFYVATSFIYAQFIPLIPIGSYLIFDDGSQRGIKIGFSLKSAFFGYLRAVSILGGIAAIVVGVITISKEILPGIVLLGAGIFGIAMFFLSYRINKASPRRAVELASEVGLDPTALAEFFVDQDLPIDDFHFERKDRGRDDDDDDRYVDEPPEVEEVEPADEPPRRLARWRYDDDDDDEDEYDDRPRRRR